MADLQKREKIMLGVTGGALLFFLYYQFVLTGDQEQPEAAARKKKTPKVNSVIMDNQLVKQKPGGINKAGLSSFAPDLKTWGRDPFREAYRLAVFDTSQTDSSAQLVLKGIIWKGNRAYVLINDSILRKGDMMGDIKVLDIKRERVICQQGGNMVTLFLDD